MPASLGAETGRLKLALTAAGPRCRRTFPPLPSCPAGWALGKIFISCVRIRQRRRMRPSTKADAYITSLERLLFRGWKGGEESASRASISKVQTHRNLFRLEGLDRCLMLCTCAPSTACRTSARLDHRRSAGGLARRTRRAPPTYPALSAQ